MTQKRLKNSKVRKYFKIEKLRDKYASADDVVRFKRLYSNKDLDLIPNENNDKTWSFLLEENNESLMKSPIYLDKLRIVEGLLKRKGGKLLSVGFGTGQLEKCISKISRDLKIYGIDISKRAVEAARKEIKGDFRMSSVENIPFKSLKFDIVVALDVFEHIPPAKIFSVYCRIGKIMSKDGLLIISVPLNENLENMLLTGTNPNHHLRKYSEDILKTELEVFGFEPTKVYKLYAFNTFYRFKTFIVNLFPIRFKKPNLIIIVAQKK